MNTRFLRRLLPQTRRSWLLAAFPLLATGLVIAGISVPEARQFAISTLDRVKSACGDRDCHDHAKEVSSRHGYVAAGQSPDEEADEHHEDEADHGHDHDHDHESEAGHDHEAESPDEHHAEHDVPDHAKESHGEKVTDHKHVESETVKLSRTAQANVGLQLAKVELRPFERTITVPAIVVERPGRTSIQVAAALTGMITRVWLMQGETVTPGQPLFDLRLTHEEVVEAQAEFLRTAEELDVVQREIDRLEKVSASGVVSGKTLLERKYEQQKLQAAQRSQRQRLLLHGLSAQQVDSILANRTLLSTLTISVPQPPEDAAKNAAKRLLEVEELKVENGQHVKAGDSLCVLADHSQLFIQGRAFEQDAATLDKAANNDWRVTAVVDGSGKSRQTVPDLPLLYVANKIEPESRAFLFYVQLPNKLIRSHETPDGHRFSSWQFKPGQRVELLVPVERWKDRIVLPIDAVVQDGPESYVFEKNGGHFDRRSVHVEYRDQFSVVIANDGVLRPGKEVIVSGAYQVHLAMKNKAGGAPDPHAGHNH